MPVDNYDELMDIDLDQLEAEWLEQANQHFMLCEAAADANKAKARAWEKKKTLRAELTLQAVEDPDLVGGKINATTLDSYFRTVDEYKEAAQALIEAEHEAEIIQGAVFSSNQRKTALENLVRLHQQEWYAGPRVPRDPATAKEAAAERRQSVRERMKGEAKATKKKRATRRSK